MAIERPWVALSLGLLATALLACPGAFAEDWPRWRGPNGDGTSAESGWDPRTLAAGPTIAWAVNVGVGHSGPVVRDGRLYTMGNSDDQDVISCLDAETGTEIWRRAYGAPPGDYGGPRATPVLSGDRLYSVSRWGQVLCLDARTGKVRWWRKLEDLKVHLPRWGLSGSPNVHGDLVILNAGKHGVALDAASGETRWFSGPGTGGYATPVIFSRAERGCAAIFAESELTVVDAVTGARLMSFPWTTEYEVNAADPIVSSGMVFVSSGYGRGCALFDITGDEPTRVWRSWNLGNHFGSSVLFEGHLYGIDGNTGSGALTCVRFRDGERQWSKSGGFEALIAVDGKLIAIDKRGDLIISEASSSAYREIARARVLSTKGAKNWTAPVLAAGRIYCRNSAGDLVCVDVRGKHATEG